MISKRIYQRDGVRNRVISCCLERFWASLFPEEYCCCHRLEAEGARYERPRREKRLYVGEREGEEMQETEAAAGKGREGNNVLSNISSTGWVD